MSRCRPVTIMKAECTGFGHLSLVLMNVYGIIIILKNNHKENIKIEQKGKGKKKKKENNFRLNIKSKLLLSWKYNFLPRK